MIKNLNNLIYKWDLEKILKNATLNELLKKYYDLQNELIYLFEQNPFISLNNLKQFHKTELNFSILSNRISNYISNNQNIDLSDNQWFMLSQEIDNKSISFYQKLASFSEKVIENKQIIQQYLMDEDFSIFKRYYESIFKIEYHKLSPEIKKFYITYSPLSSSYYSLFSILFDQEIEIKDAKDSKNKKHKIKNYSDFQKYLKNKDRTLRKNTYINWTNAIHHRKNSFCRLLYYCFLELNINAKNKNFEGGYYEYSLFSDELPMNFVFKIYENAAEWKNLVKKYFHINKKIIKKNYSLKKVEPWDTSMPIWNKTTHYSIEQAQSIILESLSKLGDYYTNHLKTIFEEKWIDWLPKKNKISGAYCIGNSYGLENKYILLNYNNTFDDIFTVAHEMGHAIHAKEFDMYQSYYADTTIFIAEIPSVLNEILLSYYFLEKYKKSNNKKKQLEIYDNLISNFINTTSSQIVFSDWEYDINQQILLGQAISADMAEQLYYKKQQKYFGIKDKKISQLKKKSLTKILTVPHFYCGNFYVYKYAVGQMIAVLLAEKINNFKTQSKTLELYYKFLRSGSSKSNLETIDILNISFNDENTWKKIKKIFKSWIKEYEQLFKVVYKNV